jgi:hypothetical protein
VPYLCKIVLEELRRRNYSEGLPHANTSALSSFTAGSFLLFGEAVFCSRVDQKMETGKSSY